MRRSTESGRAFPRAASAAAANGHGHARSPSGRRRPLPVTLAVLTVWGLFSSRCVTDHDALAKRDRGAGSDAGGSGGKGGSGGSSASSSGGEAGDDKYQEVPGRNVVTLLHAAVDAEQIAFCFARYVDGLPAFAGDPLPRGGLAFARSLSVEEIDGIDLQTDALTTFVIGGDLTLADGMDCAEAVAEARRLTEEALPVVPGVGGAGGQKNTGGAGGLGDGGDGNTGGAVAGGAGGLGMGGAVAGAENAGGQATFAQEFSGGAGGVSGSALPKAPGLMVQELATLPPGTLSGGYSFLLAPSGCFGGPWHRHEQEDLVCGSGYRGESTLIPVLVTMSRDEALRLSLQALHASRGTGELDLRVSPPEGSVDPALYVARDLLPGVIAPRPPESRYSKLEFGVDLSGFGIEVVIDNSVRLTETWTQVLNRGELETLDNGRHYTLAVVGARAGLGIAEWWNKATITVISANP